MLGWKKPKLQSRLLGEISITSDMHITPLLSESEELKSLLMKVKEESEKAGFNRNIQKTKIMASSPITSWQIKRGKVEALTGDSEGQESLCAAVHKESDVTEQLNNNS